MIWMTQPAWPSMEWNFLSSDYDTQSSFYGTQKACEPVHAQLNLADGFRGSDQSGGGTFLQGAHPCRGAWIGKTLSDHTNQVLAAADDRTAVAKPDLQTLAEGHTVFVVLEVSGRGRRAGEQ